MSFKRSGLAAQHLPLGFRFATSHLPFGFRACHTTCPLRHHLFCGSGFAAQHLLLGNKCTYEPKASRICDLTTTDTYEVPPLLSMCCFQQQANCSDAKYQASKRRRSLAAACATLWYGGIAAQLLGLVCLGLVCMPSNFLPQAGAHVEELLRPPETSADLCALVSSRPSAAPCSFGRRAALPSAGPSPAPKAPCGHF